MSDDRSTWRKVFASRHEAEAYLADRGFSVGRLQGPADRGILFGDFDIQKWRNLRATDQAALHGVLWRGMASGVAVITIFDRAPAHAHAAIRRDEPAGRSPPDTEELTTERTDQ